jgi:hypothetical protein
MSPLMNMVATKQLYKVVGIALLSGDEAVLHVDEGRLYAATSNEDAVNQAVSFWTETMGFDTFSGAYATLIDRVDGYKVVLVEDEQA